MSESEFADPQQRGADVVSVAFERPRPTVGASFASAQEPNARQVSFERRELQMILNLYGRRVAEGEWRDYAIDFNPVKAVFAIFRRASETPLYTIEKNPALARKQGAYSVVAANGLILKRGHELERVLAVLEKKLRIIK